MANASKRNTKRVHKQFDDYDYRQFRQDRSQQKRELKAERNARRQQKLQQED